MAGFIQKAPPLEITFGQGLNEKTARLLRAPGVLKLAENVSFDKAGEVRKRPGYRRLDLSMETHGGSGESIFLRVATYQDELVVYGRDWVYGTHADEENVDGAGLTRRGPAMGGNFEAFDLHAASLSEDS